MDIDKLLAESVNTRRGSSQCWALALDGDAREYLSALEAEDVKNVYQVKAVEIFGRLGVEVNTGQVGFHLHKKCKCR